jgi:hypothetical protein
MINLFVHVFICPRKTLFQITLLVCLTVLGANACQVTDAQKPDRADISERVHSLIRETLQRSEVHVNGIRIFTRSLPSTEVVDEIRKYGDDAVPALESHLASGDARERELSVRLLGALGGDRIVMPLRNVTRHDPTPSIRALALRSIRQASERLMLPIIREAAKMDTDESVRQEAKDILANYTSQ